MKKREFVDFHHVEEHQRAIHARLENWAAWSRNRAAPACAPGFELYRSSDARREYGAAPPVTADRMDAARIAKAVAALPGPHAAALSWCYVSRTGPKKARERMGLHTDRALFQLIRDGRQMLINRGA